MLRELSIGGFGALAKNGCDLSPNFAQTVVFVTTILMLILSTRLLPGDEFFRIRNQLQTANEIVGLIAISSPTDRPHPGASAKTGLNQVGML